MGLQGIGRVGRRVLAPQFVDELLGGHQSVGPHHEGAEQRTLLRAHGHDEHAGALVVDLDRTKNLKFHLVLPRENQ